MKSETNTPAQSTSRFHSGRIFAIATVTLTLDARAFSYWDEVNHTWNIDPGKSVIRVCDSSENTPLSAEMEVD
jgi:hypothetical protein